MQEDRHHQEFSRSLGGLLRSARARVLARGLLGIAAVAAVALSGAAWAAGGAQGLPRWQAVALAAMVAAAVAGSGWALLVAPLRRLGDRQRFTRLLDRAGGHANRLVAAEEALRRPDRWTDERRTSLELARRVMRDAAASLAATRLWRLLPLRGAGAALLAAAAAAVLLGGLWAASPPRLDAGLRALLPPWRAVAGTVGLRLLPGPATLVAGESAELTALELGRAAGPVSCEVRLGEGGWRLLPCRSDSLVTAGGLRRWTATMADAREDFAYRFRRGGEVTSAARVRVLHPPLIVTLAGRLEAPAYAALPPQEWARLPARLEALPGSVVHWQGRASGPLERAAVVGGNGDTLALEVDGERFAGRLAVGGPLRYRFLLEDREGLSGGSELAHEIVVLPDAHPQVELRRPGDDGLLPADGSVGLEITAADDYGLAAVALLVRREGPAAAAAAATEDGGGAWVRVPLWPAGRGEPPAVDSGFGPLRARSAPAPAGPDPVLDVRLAPVLEAGRLELVPGDALLVCAEALDGRRPGPPGRGRSRVLRLAVPSAAEVLANHQSETGPGRLAELQELRRRGRDLETDLEKLRRELLKEPEPDWARLQALREAAGRRQTLQQELERAAARLQEDLAALAQNDLTSPELMERVDEIARLLAEAGSPELDALLQRLREAAASMSSSEVAEAISEIGRRQQEMLRRLDRAMAMLKDLAGEQELEGMTSLLAQLLRRQHELTEETRRRLPEAPPPGGEPEDAARPGEQKRERQAAEPEAGAEREMAGRQEALADELAALEDRLREALERLESAPRPTESERPEDGAGEAPPDGAAGDPPNAPESEPRPGSEGADGPSEAGQKLAEALREALAQLERQRTENSMREAARNLSEHPSLAAPDQQQAVRDLAALYHVMLRSQQALQAALQQQQVGSLRRLAADLLAMSDRQERLAGEVPADLRDVRSGDLLRRQFRVLQATREVRQRLQENSAGPSGQAMSLLGDLDGLERTLQEGVRGMEEGRGHEAQRAARQALGQINRITIGLLTQASACAAGGGGSSAAMPSLARQLQEMARDQAGLNSLTDQLSRSLQEQRLSQELRAQMGRLESGQQRLADRARELEELQRNAPEGERLLGDLGRLAEEMEGVSRDLGGGMVDEQTLVRQERILGRLLDAQNSARQRDFSARRESRTAQRLFSPSDPPASVAPPDPGAEEPHRRQAVREAPLEYRELVRRYFQALEEIRKQGVLP